VCERIVWIQLQADRDLEPDGILMQHVVTDELEGLRLDRCAEGSSTLRRRLFQQMTHPIGFRRQDQVMVQTIPEAQICSLHEGAVTAENGMDRLRHGMEHLELNQVNRLEDQRQIAAERG